MREWKNAMIQGRGLLRGTFEGLSAMLIAACLAGCGENGAQRPAAGSISPVAPAAPAPAAAGPASAAGSAADAALAARVKAAITAEPGLGLHALEVVAMRGRITLFGVVRSAAARSESARVAAALPGVTEVDNQVAVVVPP